MAKAAPKDSQLLAETEGQAASDQAANLAGLDMSAWVRERLRVAARNELREYGKPVVFLSK
jgi:hypothetical protein